MAERPPLACPGCGEEPRVSEAFCSRCGMPLTRAEGDTLEEPLSDAHGRARKINPLYTEGRLVRVAGGRNQAEAELIQGLLLEEGVPSMLRRTAGFDVPDFLAAGPRDVLVPQAGLEAAKEVLLESELAPTDGAAPHPRPLVLVAAVLLGGAGVALVAWLLQSGL
jgi:hypothetical protein